MNAERMNQFSDSVKDALLNIALVECKVSPPDLAFIKAKSCLLFQQCEGLENDAINQSLIDLKDCVWKYSNNKIRASKDELEYFRSNVPNYELHLMFRWWKERDNDLVGNREYLKDEFFQMHVPIYFYTVAAMISQETNQQNVAKEVFEIALSINCQYYQCYMRIGDCLSKLHRFEPALSYYKTAMALSGTDRGYDAWCYLGLGICLHKIGSFQVGGDLIRFSRKIATESFGAYRVWGYSSWDGLYAGLNL